MNRDCSKCDGPSFKSVSSETCNASMKGEVEGTNRLYICGKPKGHDGDHRDDDWSGHPIKWRNE